jgi:hypothetical protein
VTLGRIEFERPTLERFYREDYEALAVDLERLGWTVVEVPRDERRSWDIDTGIELAGLWIVFRVGNAVLDSVIDQLVETIKQRLVRPRDRRQPPRRCVIYGPNGEHLREISLDSHDDEP